MSTEDQTTGFVQAVQNAFEQKKHVRAVFVDLEKAYDKVWRLGMLSKLAEMGVGIRTFRWIKAFISQRKAEVRLNNRTSKTFSPQEGLAQGTVLAPTLFLVFINDLARVLREEQKVEVAMFADDLVMWTAQKDDGKSEETMQKAVNVLDEWAEKWMVSVNEDKTCVCTFSMKHDETGSDLKYRGKKLENVTEVRYLGIWLDRKLTFQRQIEEATKAGKQRMTVLRRLAGTTWGSGSRTLKKLYTGRVRPVLEYGAAAWAGITKGRTDAIQRVQHQAERIISGAMKSTPLEELHKYSGLEKLEDRRKGMVVKQVEKARRMNDNVLKRQIEKGKTVVKRTKKKTLWEIANDTKRLWEWPEEERVEKIDSNRGTPPWVINRTGREIIWEDSLEEPTTKKEETLVLRSIAMSTIQNRYKDWIKVYTDGSAEGATKNAGAGGVIVYQNNRRDEFAIAAGRNGNNYTGEVTAIREAVRRLKDTGNATGERVVILTDSQAAIRAMKRAGKHKSKMIEETVKELETLREQQAEEVAVQWIPGHVGLSGNERADWLAKKGGKQPQMMLEVSMEDVRQRIKRNTRSEADKNERKEEIMVWKELGRKEQVEIMRLRTGHCRLNQHMKRLGLEESDKCACGEVETPEHFLTECSLLEEERRRIWRGKVTMERALYGRRKHLEKTAMFIRRTSKKI